MFLDSAFDKRSNPSPFQKGAYPQTLDLNLAKLLTSF